jgi:Tfp pilus assembly protein PilO
MNTARIIIALLVVVAIVALAFVSGWADDRAPAGSKGRVPVTAPATNTTP